MDEWLRRAGFVGLRLRLLNGYGDKPGVQGDSTLQTLMSFFNITKYPPSLLFITLTLSLGLLLLRGFERRQGSRWILALSVFGSAPMFFYLLHLYVLKFAYLLAVACFGLNQGNYSGFDSVWAAAGLLALTLYLPVRGFSRLKSRRRDLAWFKCFQVGCRHARHSRWTVETSAHNTAAATPSGRRHG